MHRLSLLDEALAILFGTASAALCATMLWSLDAAAQGTVLADPPSPIDLAWGVAAVLVVNVVVLFARAAFPAYLAPDVATPQSRNRTRLVGLAVGLLTGLIGLAPATPVVLPWGAEIVGRIVSGVIVAGFAMFGRDVVVRGIVRPLAGEKDDA